MSEITILGANGWIGSALAHFCEHKKDHKVHRVGRRDLTEWMSSASLKAQDIVFYCIGLTSDFRNKPHETIKAHSTILSSLIQQVRIDNLVYLSSSRVYSRADVGKENVDLTVNPNQSSDIYNISKLLGESLVLSIPKPGFKVARLSNVLGKKQPSHTFVGQLLASARMHRQVTIMQAAATAKDYISLDNVVELLYAVAFYGKDRIYNIARGENTSHAYIAHWLSLFDCQVDFAHAETNSIEFPMISNDRISREFSPRLVDPFNSELFKSFIP
tara:strand:- start:3570 stop:4388 length:819 start_codon:yes stop_codon:yes gene_type:complete